MKCMALQCGQANCYFKAKICDGKFYRQYVMPLCQYKSDTECYKNSELAIQERNLKDELIKLGDTKIRTYYGGTKQVCA